MHLHIYILRPHLRVRRPTLSKPLLLKGSLIQAKIEASKVLIAVNRSRKLPFHGVPLYQEQLTATSNIIRICFVYWNSSIPIQSIRKDIASLWGDFYQHDLRQIMTNRKAIIDFHF